MHVASKTSEEEWKSLCREAALEGCKAQMTALQQHISSETQQLEVLEGRTTQQTAELHQSQALVAQLQSQV